MQGLYHLTKTLDPTRPVVGNDGWENVGTDIIGIHDYDERPERLRRRYGLDYVEGQFFGRERPGGRMLVVDGKASLGQPIVLTEFGGIAMGEDHDQNWGYSRCETPADFLKRYRTLMEIVRGLPALAGFCYTQFTDTYQEANGLVFADRTPKVPPEEIASATNGPVLQYDAEVEAAWRECLMDRR